MQATAVTILERTCISEKKEQQQEETTAMVRSSEEHTHGNGVADDIVPYSKDKADTCMHNKYF